jgi:D-glycero-alpha-D-manno-heptose 1-phosphate guanylyltransferase
MEAMILCGGLGTRLGPLTKDTPKPMLPIGDRPFLEYVLAYLNLEGVSRVVLCTGYKSEIIENHFGSTFAGLSIVYSRETEPLGTGGAVKKALNCVDSDEFFIMNGDTICDLKLAELKSRQTQSNADIVIGAVTVPDTARYGSLTLDDESLVVGFSEKGISGEGPINAGIYLVKRAPFETFSKELSAFSFENEILKKRITRARIAASNTAEMFLDIGIVEDLEKFRSLAKSNTFIRKLRVLLD